MLACKTCEYNKDCDDPAKSKMFGGCKRIATQKLSVDKLKKINATINQCKGICMIDAVISYMEHDHKDIAIDVIRVDSDKIRVYPVLVDYFRRCEETCEFY